MIHNQQYLDEELRSLLARGISIGDALRIMHLDRGHGLLCLVRAVMAVAALDKSEAQRLVVHEVGVWRSLVAAPKRQEQGSWALGYALPAYGLAFRDSLLQKAQVSLTGHPTSIPHEVLTKLRRGQWLAVEVVAPKPEMRAYVMVIPEGSVRKEHGVVFKYEIRYLEHLARYTSTDWGWDYDYVLHDETTRIKRVFIDVEQEGQIAEALAPWLTDISQLRDPVEFDSSLLNGHIEGYLDR